VKREKEREWSMRFVCVWVCVPGVSFIRRVEAGFAYADESCRVVEYGRFETSMHEVYAMYCREERVRTRDRQYWVAVHWCRLPRDSKKYKIFLVLEVSTDASYRLDPPFTVLPPIPHPVLTIPRKNKIHADQHLHTTSPHILSQTPPDRLLVGVIEPDETSSVLVSDKREGVITNF
jgi:hypothetical protein